MDIRQKLKQNLTLIGIFTSALFLGIIVTLLVLPILGISLAPNSVGS